MATPKTTGTAQALRIDMSTAPLRPVRVEGADRGRDDDRERGADAERHPHLVGHADDAEELVEDGHDDGAAADPEDAGEQPGRGPRGEKRGDEPGKFVGGMPNIEG